MNIINHSTECDICMSNRESNTFKCNTCSHSVCVSCFCKISKDYYSDIKKKSILSFKCPFCRDEKDYGFVNFNGSEVIYLATQHLRVIKRVLKERDDNIDELTKQLKVKDDIIDAISKQLTKINLAYTLAVNANKKKEATEIIHLKNQICSFKHTVNSIKTKTITTTKLQRMILT